MYRFRATCVVGALTCYVCPLLFQFLKLSLSDNVFYWRLVWRAHAVQVCVRQGVPVASLRSRRASKTGMLPLRQIFHELQPLVLLVDVDLLVEQLGRVLVFLFVNSFTLSVKTFLILPLLIIDVLLKASMHFEGGVEPIFYRVVGSASHMLGNERPFFAMLQGQAH